MQTNRTEKVAGTIQKMLSEILLRHVKDPDLNLVTILHVKVSKDLRNAKVYFSVLGDQERQKRAIQAMNRAKGFLRSEVGHQLQLRLVPELDFIYDNSAEYAMHINELINQLKQDE